MSRGALIDLTTISHYCDECRARIEGNDIEAFGDAYIAHARSAHPDWPYPDVAIRNYAEATQRIARPAERLGAIGAVEIHPVTEDRMDDWLAFFDRDAFAGNPAWASCYCSTPTSASRMRNRGPALRGRTGRPCRSSCAPGCLSAISPMSTASRRDGICPVEPNDLM